MPRLCQNCGKPVPNDAVLCPYCGTQIDYLKAAYVNDNMGQKSSDSTKILLIVLAVIAVIIVVVILIAASAYFYVSDMVGPEPHDHPENAHVTIDSDDNMIGITLAKKGDNYNNGYNDFYIWVNGDLVEDLSEVGYWTVGETINIGESNYGYAVDGSPLSSGDYEISVTIKDTLIYNGDITIY